MTFEEILAEIEERITYTKGAILERVHDDQHDAVTAARWVGYEKGALGALCDLRDWMEANAK